MTGDLGLGVKWDVGGETGDWRRDWRLNWERWTQNDLE
jgi:hypothetical protein